MIFPEQIIQYIPGCNQEEQDKKVILNYIAHFPHNILLRENEFAHITSSGFVINRELDKVLMVYHNIRNTWAWTGGHADGDEDLLHVAIQEAREETGIKEVTPLTNNIAAIDILPVYGHLKNGKYVSAHLHLSIAYILVSSEKEELIVKKDENSGVNWVSIDKFNKGYFDAQDVYLYNKLLKRAKQIRKFQTNDSANFME